MSKAIASPRRKGFGKISSFEKVTIKTFVKLGHKLQKSSFLYLHFEVIQNYSKTDKILISGQ